MIQYIKIKNPAILPLFGFTMTDFEDKPFPTILSEYMPKGSLDQLLKQNPNLSLTDKYIILIGIAEGMNYLESQGIIHGNLKPSNILIDDNCYPYICDFYESYFNIPQTSTSSSLFKAPEVKSGYLSTIMSDVYSFSLIAYGLITSKFPSHDDTTFSEENWPDLSLINNEQLRSLISECMSNDPKQRPPFKAIIDEIKKLMN